MRNDYANLFKSPRVIKASLDRSPSHPGTWSLTPMLQEFGGNAPGWDEGVQAYGACLSTL